MFKSLSVTWLLGLMVFALVGSGACHFDPNKTPDEAGKVSLSLTGTAGGVTYRLRNARFTITAALGGVAKTLDSESEPDATTLSLALPPGMYSVNLESGWVLERLDTNSVVDALLTSPNPRTFQILTGSATNLTYAFSTSGGPVALGEGTLNIDISITSTADGGVFDGGTSLGCTVSPNTCGPGFVCQLSDNGNGMTQGTCVMTCDPVTQVRSDGAPACGSANPGSPDRGCYGSSGGFTCAQVPAQAAGRTHGAPAFGPSGGGAFINGCAPGYQPRFFASSSDPTVVCTAYCQPTATYAGNATNANGVKPHSCGDRGAPGSECLFLSSLDTPTALTNTIGVCFDAANFTYDPDSNPATPPIPYPLCATLSSSDTDGNGIADYLEWGCGPQPLP